MEDLVAQARAYAIEAHRAIDHRRKYSGEPYHVHLERVAAKVEAAGADQESIAAAWLHDVVEDTPTDLKEMQQRFGPAVSSLVQALTDTPHSAGNRAHRKELDRARLAAAEARVHTIKLADLVDNLPDVCAHDAHFGRVFLREAMVLLPLLSKGAPALQQEAQTTIETCRAMLRQSRVPRSA